MPHRSVEKSSDVIPTVSNDYAFFGAGKVADSSRPTLIIKDRTSKCIFAHPVPTKGNVEEYPSEAMSKDLRFLGYRRINLRCDQESPIKALNQKVREKWIGDCSIEYSPKGESKSNGEIERAVQEMEMSARTIKADLEIHAKMEFKGDEPILMWLIEHASTVHNLFHRGAPHDGMTPYRRLKGREWKVPIPTFGESVEFQIHTTCKLDSRWQRGVFLGIRLHTTEKIVGTKDTIFTVRSIRQLPSSERYDPDLIRSIQGVPWDPRGEKKTTVVDLGGAAHEDPPNPAPSAKEGEAKRVRIELKDIKKFGATSGCPQCRELIRGRKHGGFRHTDECRRRLEKAMKESDDPATRERVRRSEEVYAEKMAAGVQRRVEEEKEEMLAKETILRKEHRREAEEGEPRENEDHKSSKKARIDVGLPVTAPQGVSGRDDYRNRSETQNVEGLPVTASQGVSVRDDYPPRDGTAIGEERLHPKEDDQSPPAKKGRINLMEAEKEDGRRKIKTSSRGGVERRLYDEIVVQRKAYVLSTSNDERPVCEERNIVVDSTLVGMPIEDMAIQVEKYGIVAFDDISGKPLIPAKVQEAREEEIRQLKKIGVFGVCRRDRVPTAAIHIRGRWVDINKGDDRKPKYRSRYVGQELKKKSGLTSSESLQKFFAAMPPLSSIKLLLSLATTRAVMDLDGAKIRTGRSEQKLITVIDVKRAHFWADATREIYCELPIEYGVDTQQFVGRLIKSLYGTQDAAKNWELTIRKVLIRLGFRQGKSTPCMYWHPEKDIRTTIHGDDFIVLSTMVQSEWLEAELGKEWTLEVRARMGPPGMPGVRQHCVILNRLVTWDVNGIQWESDSRHVEILMKELEVRGTVTTPLTKEAIMREEYELEDHLEPEGVTKYRSLAMRIGYLAQDRPDLLRATREIAKAMQKPKMSDIMRIKRVGRYLNLWPRIVQRFDYQEAAFELSGWTDTDHAGCIRSRKSTTGGTITFGNHALSSWSRGQAVVALSSGEAEFYGCVTMASELVGVQSMCQDFGVRVKTTLRVDASTAIAMSARRGLGKSKHVDTQYFWIQDMVNSGLLRIRKEATGTMLADFLTKPTEASTISRCLSGLGYVAKSGRHELSLRPKT